MYCAPSDIIATTCGQHVLSMLPGKDGSTTMPIKAKGECIPGAAALFQDPLAWAPVTVPAYIAYGLLKQNSKLDKQGNAGKRCPTSKGQLTHDDQELHQEMLQKLALHLAAQPHTLETECFQTKVPVEQALGGDSPSAQKSPPPSPLCKEKQAGDQKSHHCNDTRVEIQTKGKGLSPQDQDFQQEMLRKLALHLAAVEEVSPEAQNDAQRSAEETEMNEVIVTPDVFPATPSSFDDNCEHYYIGDELEDHIKEETVSCSQCVSVPMHIAYGLIQGVVPRHDHRGGKVVKAKSHAFRSSGPDEQDFHNQMLQKLALHLAAQPEPLVTPALPEQNKHETVRCPSKMAWADMVDDDVDLSQPVVAAKEPKQYFEDENKHGTAGRTAGLLTSKRSKTGHPDLHAEKQELLRKLALHLAAQDQSLERPEAEVLGSVKEATALGENKEKCDSIIAELEAPVKAGRISEIVELVLPGSRSLSLTPCGSRLVQKVIDVASAQQREQLLKELLKDVTELYTSPHANHVIAKLIEIMPARNLASIGEAMRGKATTVARHQFGSRIIERLIEHCSEDMIGFLLEEVLEDFEALARHQFGNFVVARLLEHSTPARKHSCVQKLLPHVLQHATHKTACNIVERMLDNVDLASQAMIADAFLAGSGDTSLEVIATTRYGSFVIQHLVNRFHPRIDAVKARVKAAHSQLQASGFSQRKIVQFLGEAFFRA